MIILLDLCGQHISQAQDLKQMFWRRAKLFVATALI
jgi:hypothetical protein